MGCDIHFFVEYKRDGAWHSADVWGVGAKRCPARWHRFYEGRRYELFGKLAGVRGDGPALVEPRGLPDNMSHELAAWTYEDVDHTPSWLTLAELQSWDFSTVCPSFEYGTKERMDNLVEEADDYKPENVRCVFWFDS